MVLTCKMLSTREVVCFHQVGCLTKEILGAAIRSKVIIIAVILSYLKKVSWLKSTFIAFMAINITLILQLLVTVEVPDPILNPRSLHISDESTNTIWRIIHVYVLYVYCIINVDFLLLCSPVFVPQICGGALFPGEVTVKISVWHCPVSW